MKIDPVDYTEKTDARPVIDRTKQSTAGDWNVVKRVTDELVGFLHVESGPLVRSSYHAEKVFC